MKTPMIVIAAAAALCAAAPAHAASKAAAPPPPAGPTAADWRTPDPADVLVIDTNQGRILVEMVPEAAPAHVQRVRELVRDKFYDGLKFFRVIEGFMDQTGDPQNNGTGSSTKPDLTQEFALRRGPQTPFVLAKDLTVAEAGFMKSLPMVSQSMMLAPMTKDGKVAAHGLFCAGVAGAARGDDPNSANSQFFLMRDDYPALNGRYTAWGRVIAGQDVVRKIKVGEPPSEPMDRMERVRLLADLPQAERPTVRVIDPAGAWFKAEAARIAAEKGAAFSPCDMNVPTEVK